MAKFVRFGEEVILNIETVCAVKYDDNTIIVCFNNGDEWEFDIETSAVGRQIRNYFHNISE